MTAEEAIAHVRERRRGSLGDGYADRLRTESAWARLSQGVPTLRP